ncbi:MAG: hypothetical protein K2X47_08435 [Bdellovibrionales bacterium]|nr:hypothetical protein [Bdellovibrionales bacterium]
MSRKIQINLTEEAWKLVEESSNEASENFDIGTITYSDVINEMILTSKIDIKILQGKHTDIRRSLRKLASMESIDVEAAIKCLNDLKSKVPKKKNGNTIEETSL